MVLQNAQEEAVAQSLSRPVACAFIRSKPQGLPGARPASQVRWLVLQCEDQLERAAAPHPSMAPALAQKACNKPASLPLQHGCSPRHAVSEQLLDRGLTMKDCRVKLGLFRRYKPHSSGKDACRPQAKL